MFFNLALILCLILPGFFVLSVLRIKNQNIITNIIYSYILSMIISFVILYIGGYLGNFLLLSNFLLIITVFSAVYVLVFFGLKIIALKKIFFRFKISDITLLVLLLSLLAFLFGFLPINNRTLFKF